MTDDANITKAWTIIWSGYHYDTRTILWYRWSYQTHYSDVMSATVSQITGVSLVCINLCSDPDQRKHQSSAWLAFERGIHRWPVDTPNKGPVTRKHHEPPHLPPIPCNQGLPRDTFMSGTSQTKKRSTEIVLLSKYVYQYRSADDVFVIMFLHHLVECTQVI